MTSKTDYETDTRLAYNASKANSYKRQQTKGVSWMRFTTWREKLCVKKALKKCNLPSAGKILDIPCGTGILGSVFTESHFSVFASDISRDMMNLAYKDYKKVNFGGFIQADITKPPFITGTFDCVITLGLMHRLPADIRKEALQGLITLSNKYIIVSYSIDNPVQRLKQWLIRKLKPRHKSAPSPVPIHDIIRELSMNGLIIKRKFDVMPSLSAEVVFLLEKRN